ncbi:MAG: hypothetical protein AAGF31_11200 [Planctomycetota bacterium]
MPRPLDPTHSLACRLLQIAVVCQCFGNAWWFGMVGETPLFAWLWGEPEVGGFGLSEATVVVIHQTLAVFWLVAGLLIAWRPLRPLLATLTLLQLTIAVAMAATASGFRLDTSWLPTSLTWLADAFPLLSQSTRIATPAALMMLVGKPSGEETRQAPAGFAFACLRWCVAITFAAHGVEALQHYHVFSDMNITAARNLLGTDISESTSNQILVAIGIMDVLVAAVAAVMRSPLAAGYMTIWGLITAASRVVVYGVAIGAWGFATRAPHFLAPAALLAIWLSHKQPESEYASQPTSESSD